MYLFVYVHDLPLSPALTRINVTPLEETITWALMDPIQPFPPIWLQLCTIRRISPWSIKHRLLSREVCKCNIRLCYSSLIWTAIRLAWVATITTSTQHPWIHLRRFYSEVAVKLFTVSLNLRWVTNLRALTTISSTCNSRNTVKWLELRSVHLAPSRMLKEVQVIQALLQAKIWDNLHWLRVSTTCSSLKALARGCQEDAFHTTNVKLSMING